MVPITNVLIGKIINDISMIKIKCKCGNEKTVDRDDNIPDEAVSIRCNYCPKCEKQGSDGDYYEEEYLNMKGEIIIH